LLFGIEEDYVEIGGIAHGIPQHPIFPQKKKIKKNTSGK
jgi:hypothetical protein